MDKFFKNSFIVCCLMFLCSLSFAGLSVNPSVINVKGVPGSGYKNAYSLTSTYENPVTVVLEISKGNCFSGNKDVDVNDWLKFEKTEFNLKPGETVKVPYEVLINDNMKGSLCGRVSFAAQQSSMINLSISVPIYVIVEGTENIDFEISSLSLNINSNDGSLYYKMTIKNNGNVHIRHSGRIQIYSTKNKKKVKTVPIEESVPTYCESSRDFNGTIPKLEDGKYVALFVVNALDNKATKQVKFKIKNNEIKILKIK